MFTFRVNLGLNEGISIDADSGPLRYVLLCRGGICHQQDTFIQIGSGHNMEWDILLHNLTSIGFSDFFRCLIFDLSFFFTNVFNNLAASF